MKKHTATVMSALSLLCAALAAFAGCAERPSYVRPNPSKIAADLRYGSDGCASPVTLIGGTANEFWGRISSDGKKILYVSDEKGNHDLFLQDYPPERARRFSIGGGRFSRPVFARRRARRFISKRRDAKETSSFTTLKKTNCCGLPTATPRKRPGVARQRERRLRGQGRGRKKFFN
jgi:hypothetical protein